MVPPAGAATAPPTNESSRPGAAPQSQWPPPEWGVQSATHAVSHATHAAYANQSQTPTQGVGGAPPGPDGANISRPQTFSASSYGGDNLRPVSSLNSRPSNPTTPPGGYPVSPISETPSSAYPGASSYNPQSAFSVGPPQPTIPSIAPRPEVAFHGQSHGPVDGQAAGPSTYPGQQQSSAYPPSNYGGGGWPGGPPPPSPPSHNPLGGMPTFSGHSSYGNNSRPYGGPAPGPPPQSQYPGGPSFPSAHQHSPLGSPGGSGGGPPFFPQAPGGDGGYFGSSSNVTMPAASSIASTSTSPYAPGGSPSSPSMYPGQYSSYPGQASAGGAGMSYPQAAVPTPGPWMPSGPPGPSTSMPPNFPPPPRPQSKPSSGPSFPMASSAGSSAYGFALSAVDKVAGRKTREQLENQVGNLAQSGSKLFNKFTK